MQDAQITVYIAEVVEAQTAVQATSIIPCDPSKPHTLTQLIFWPSVEPDVALWPCGGSGRTIP